MNQQTALAKFLLHHYDNLSMDERQAVVEMLTKEIATRRVDDDLFHYAGLGWHVLRPEYVEKGEEILMTLRDERGRPEWSIIREKEEP